jgi:hypothetical protein
VRACVRVFVCVCVCVWGGGGATRSGQHQERLRGRLLPKGGGGGVLAIASDGLRPVGGSKAPFPGECLAVLTGRGGAELGSWAELGLKGG